MKKHSLKNENTIKKMNSVVDKLLAEEKTAGIYPVIDENMPADQSDIPSKGPTPEPMRKEVGSEGSNVIIDGEEVANPEYVYDVDVPIYTKPERSGDGYAPLQRELDPQYDQGYAPGTKTRSEEMSVEEDCGCSTEAPSEDTLALDIAYEIGNLLGNSEVSPERRNLLEQSPGIETMNEPSMGIDPPVDEDLLEDMIEEQMGHKVSPVENVGNVEVININTEDDPKLEEVSLDSDVIKQYYPSTMPTWPTRRGE